LNFDSNLLSQVAELILIKSNMKISKGELFFLGACAIMIAVLLLGCGSTKTAVQSNTKVTEVTHIKADTQAYQVIVKKQFGDTLTAQHYIPIPLIKDTSAKAKPYTFNVEIESKGIKHKEKFTPIYNHSQLVGLTEDDTTIAKPTQITSSAESKHSTVSTETVKDSTAKVHTKTTQSIGWGLFSWPWWIYLGLALIITTGIYLLKKIL